jgi:hypothetical protein
MTGSHRVGVLVSAVDKGRSFRYTVLLLYSTIFLPVLERFQKVLSSRTENSNSKQPYILPRAAEGDGMSSVRQRGHAAEKEREDYGSGTTKAIEGDSAVVAQADRQKAVTKWGWKEL